MEMQEYTSEKLREHYFGFTHKSGLRVYVFPKKMSTSYALFATRYGSLENSFKLATDAVFHARDRPKRAGHHRAGDPHVRGQPGYTSVL